MNENISLQTLLLEVLPRILIIYIRMLLKSKLKLSKFLIYSSLIENLSLNLTLDIPIRIAIQKPFHTPPLRVFLLIVICVCKAKLF